MSSLRGPADVAGLILAGGKASRFGGRVKALVEIRGRPILERMLEVLSPRLADMAISANDPIPYRGTGLPVLPDAVPGQGPLAGIAAGLRWCRRPYLMVFACDMPYPHPGVVNLLLSRRAADVDVVAPFVGDRPEPLFALYSPTILPVIEARLAAGRLGARGVITDAGLHVSPLYEAELRRIDPELRCFTNINSAGDLAEDLAGSAHRHGGANRGL